MRKRRSEQGEYEEEEEEEELDMDSPCWWLVRESCGEEDEDCEKKRTPWKGEYL